MHTAASPCSNGCERGVASQQCTPRHSTWVLAAVSYVFMPWSGAPCETTAVPSNDPMLAVADDTAWLSSSGIVKRLTPQFPACQGPGNPTSKVSAFETPCQHCAEVITYRYTSRLGTPGRPADPIVLRLPCLLIIACPILYYSRLVQHSRLRGTEACMPSVSCRCRRGWLA